MRHGLPEKILQQTSQKEEREGRRKHFFLYTFESVRYKGTTMSKQWKTIEGGKVADIRQTITDLLASGKREVHIGSDSQQSGKFTEFVTVLVLYEQGKGGRAFYIREKTPRVKALRERLLKEVWMSVDFALQISDLVEANDLTVHIDANPNIKFESSRYVKELVSMVMSQGFKTLTKPDAWCASHAADHVVKVKVMGM